MGIEIFEKMLAPILKREREGRRRYAREFERLSLRHQVAAILKSGISFSVGTLIGARHGRNPRPIQLAFVRLEWMVQDQVSRPRVGWRIWVYAKPRAYHFDVVLKLARVRA